MSVISFHNTSQVRLQCVTCHLFYLADSAFPFDQCPDCLNPGHALRPLPAPKVHRDLVERRRKHQALHRQERLAAAKAYYQAHKEELKQYQVEYSRTHREKINTRRRAALMCNASGGPDGLPEEG